MTTGSRSSSAADRAASSVVVWRRRARTAQVLLLVITLLGLVYVTDTVVGGTLFRDPDRLTVALPGAAGLHEGSTVNYRGQRIGEVVTVGLADGDEQHADTSVVAEIQLDGDTRIPKDSRLEVRNLSAIGEQYLDVRPRSAGGPYYADGAHIGPDAVHLPLPTPRVLAHAQRLMRHIDVADIRTITAETEAIFADGQVDLRALSVELETAFALLRELEPDLTRLARRAETPLRTGVELGESLTRIARDLALVSQSLRQATPDVRRLVVTATDLLPRLDRWWRESSPALRRLLREGLPVAEMSAEHLRGLHEWLDWAPRQADAMAGSTRDGSGRVVLVPRILDNCLYEGVRRRDPHQTNRLAPPTNARCTNPPEGTQQRGSRNVPDQ